MIRSEIAKLLVEEVSDPSLKDITVTDVLLSADLKNAKVFFSQTHFQEKDLKISEIKKGLKRAMPFFRRQLAHHLSLRVVPELSFEEDTHTQDVARLMGLLESVKQEGNPLQ